jgi:hypothetical protein
MRSMESGVKLSKNPAIGLRGTNVSKISALARGYVCVAGDMCIDGSSYS